MSNKTNNNGHIYASIDRKVLHSSEGQMLSHEEYYNFSEKQRTLRAEIADLNRKISNDSAFHKSFPTKQHFNKWKDKAIRQRDQLLADYNAVAEIMTASETARKAIFKERRNRLNSIDVVDMLSQAKQVIESLYEKCGDDWAEDDRILCTMIRHVTGPHSPLLDMVKRQDTEAELAVVKKQHAQEIARERAASQQAVGVLKAQIRDLQEQRGRAAAVLDRLYSERYQEIDEFRKARGVTHRIHLTAADCKEIENAING